MATKRVIAHFMHETEMSAAKSMLSSPQATESYVIGEIDESQIPTMETQGLIVQILGDPTPLETPGTDAFIAPGVTRRTLRFGVAGGVAAAEEETPVATAPDYFLIQLNAPLVEHARQQLNQLAVKLLEIYPPDGYSAYLTSPQADAVRALPFVATIRRYDREDTGPTTAAPPSGVRLAPGAPPVQLRMLTLDLRLHRAEDLPTVLAWLADHKVSVAGSSARKIRIYVLEDSPLSADVAALPEVASCEEYIRPTLHNDVARALLALDAPGGGTAIVSQTGAGEVVGIADTGLDEAHPDLASQIAGVVALGRRGDATDPHGHGTHVCGSVLGDGTASQGKIRGTAPGARVFFQSLLDSSGGLGGLPLTLGELFDEAYQAGARIHNNSWGAATRAVYTIDSSEVDDFVATHRDMLIVISAGNEGQASMRLNSQPGFVDWLSLSSPASCKNALTVGASRSSRTAGGLAGMTYGDAWPHDFPDPPIKSQNVSGDPEAIAAFSSRGPCDDRRIKPDLVAPGTDIVSTKSSRAPLRNFWGPCPGNGLYAFMGGTSMAAPLVTGCAALVREYFVKDRNHKPSAALLKAALINSTRWLTGADAIADFALRPNFNQGFGLLDMSRAIPNAGAPNFRVEFVDTWDTKPMHFSRTGQRLRYRVQVAAGEPLRICMAWTDLPGRALQNNLDLFLQFVPGGPSAKWLGNQDLPHSLKIPDPDNNIEVIRVDKPLAGEYLIQIAAFNLLHPGQDVALVVAGNLTSPLTPVP